MAGSELIIRTPTTCLVCSLLSCLTLSYRLICSESEDVSTKLTLHILRTLAAWRCCGCLKRCVGERKTSHQPSPSSSHPCNCSGWTWPSTCTWTPSTRTRTPVKTHIVQAESGVIPCWWGEWGESSLWLQQTVNDECTCGRCLPLFPWGRRCTRQHENTISKKK